VYEEKPEVNYIEGIRFPWQWISQDVATLKLKVGGDWAIVDGRKLVRRLEAPREITRDEPRQHWTDIYCGHLSVGEFLRDVDCPVVSEWQDAAY